MKKVSMVYLVHFADLTGRDEETIEVEAETLGDLIAVLDERYPGMGRLLCREDGSAAPNNAVILNRQGERARFIFDFSLPLESLDHLTLI